MDSLRQIKLHVLRSGFLLDSIAAAAAMNERMISKPGGILDMPSGDDRYMWLTLAVRWSRCSRKPSMIMRQSSTAGKLQADPICRKQEILKRAKSVIVDADRGLFRPTQYFIHFVYSFVLFCNKQIHTSIRIILIFMFFLSLILSRGLPRSAAKR